jgi:hypothetical protein
MAQVFVVVGAANVIAFIIRDLGEPAIVGWIIQVTAIQPIIIDRLLTPAGTSSYSSYPFTHRGPLVRCRGQKIFGLYPPIDCLRGSSCLC